MSNSNVPQKSNATEFSMKSWVGDTVKQSVVPLLPKGEEDWKGWVVALKAATLKNPGLEMALRENPGSGLLSLIKCARLGLSPDPALQHFAMIPYKGVIEGQVMYRGWMHIAMSTGLVEWMHADVVYKGEAGSPFVDPITGKVNHNPDPFGRDAFKDADIIGAYCMVKLKGRDRLETRTLSRGEIEKRRAKGTNGPGWREWYKEMCIAKAIKALFSSGRIPLTQRQSEAFADDEEEVKAADVSAVRTALPAAPSLPPPPAPRPAPPTEDPFPPEQEAAERWRHAIDMEAGNRDLSPEQVDVICQDLHGKPLSQLDMAQLQGVYNKLVGGGE